MNMLTLCAIKSIKVKAYRRLLKTKTLRKRAVQIFYVEIISTNFRNVSPVTTLVDSRKNEIKIKMKNDIGINEPKMSAMYVS